MGLELGEELMVRPLMSRQHIILDLNLSLIPHAQIHKKSCVCVYAKLCIYLWVYTVVPPYLLDLGLVPGYPPALWMPKLKDAQVPT